MQRTYKALILGEAETGKTSLVTRYLNGWWQEKNLDSVFEELEESVFKRIQL